MQEFLHFARLLLDPLILDLPQSLTFLPFQNYTAAIRRQICFEPFFFSPLNFHILESSPLMQ